MKTVVLDKCARVLNYWNEYDEQLISLIEDTNTDFIKGFVEPFRRELIENLLSKASFQEKKELIMFYIDELHRAALVQEDYKSIGQHELLDDNDFPLFYASPDLPFDRFNMAKVRTHFLYALFFNEIQTYCSLFDIPFLKICNDMCFPLNTINTEYTMDNEEMKNLSPPQNSEVIQPQRDIRPTFLTDSVPHIFDILKSFFAPEHQIELLRILKSGGNASKPLLFNDSGNRLADAFKQLFDYDIIIGCQKKELENWIGQNFHYRYRDKIMKYTPRYLSDILSTTKDKCQKPILNIIKQKSTGTYLINKL